MLNIVLYRLVKMLGCIPVCQHFAMSKNVVHVLPN